MDILPINIQATGGTDWLTLLLPLVLCCVMPTLFRQPGQSVQLGNEFDSWYVNYGIQEAYETITEEVAEWREQTKIRKSRSRFAFLSGSFLSRRKRSFFEVDQEVQPKLYRVHDDERGEISFELTEVEEGGTSIKASYGSKARMLIQDLKTKMPVKIPAVAPSTIPNICPACGKKMMPDFSTCPYCGTKLN